MCQIMQPEARRLFSCDGIMLRPSRPIRAALLICLVTCLIHAGPQAFALPDSPTVEELFSSRVLPEPLVSFGSEPTAANNQTLAVALKAFEKKIVADDFSVLDTILL